MNPFDEASADEPTPSPSPVSSPSPAGGVREALVSRKLLLEWADDFDEASKKFERLEKCVLRTRAQECRDLAALSSPATPEPVSAPEHGEVLREICTDMLDAHHGRQAPMDVDAPSFGRGAAAGWDAAVSAFYKRALAALSNPAPGHGEGGL